MPVSMISSSSCFWTFATTSSMRAGCILPSTTSWCSASLATSLLTGSNAERRIASGVSSTTISTPVAASRALMFLPSRPMIRPLISSLSILNTVTAFSIAVSDAVLWMVLITILLASLLAVSLASSMTSLMYDWACDLASAFMLSISWFLASEALMPAMLSICSMACALSFSYSSALRLAISTWFLRLSLMASASFCFLPSSAFCWFRVFSFCFSLFSVSWIWLFFSLIYCSCSLLSCRNFSLAWNIFSCFMLSASSWAFSSISSFLPFRMILRIAA